MSRVLIVYCSTDPNYSISIRHRRIIEYLQAFHDTYVIDIGNECPPTRYGRKFNSIANRVIYAPQSYTYKICQIRRLIARKIAECECNNVVLLVKPYYLLRAIKTIKAKNVNVVCDLSDPYLCNVGLERLDWFSRLKMKLFERKYFRLTDHLVVLNQEIKEHYDKICMSVVVVEQSLERSMLRSKKEAATEQFSDSPVVQLVYAGKFYKGIREPYQLYRAVEQCKGTHLKLFTQQDESCYMPGNIENIEVQNAVDQRELYKIYSIADVIVFIDNERGIQVPGKTLEILATGKPILFIYTNEKSPSLKYVREYEGVLYARNEANAIREVLTAYSSKEKKLWERDLEKYTWDSTLKAYNRILV